MIGEQPVQRFEPRLVCGADKFVQMRAKTRFTTMSFQGNMARSFAKFRMKVCPNRPQSGCRLTQFAASDLTLPGIVPRIRASILVAKCYL